MTDRRILILSVVAAVAALVVAVGYGLAGWEDAEQ